MSDSDWEQLSCCSTSPDVIVLDGSESDLTNCATVRQLEFVAPGAHANPSPFLSRYSGAPAMVPGGSPAPARVCPSPRQCVVRVHVSDCIDIDFASHSCDGPHPCDSRLARWVRMHNRHTRTRHGELTVAPAQSGICRLFVRRQEKCLRRGCFPDWHGWIPSISQRPIILRTGAAAGECSRPPPPPRGRLLCHGCCCLQIVVLTYPLVGNYGIPDTAEEDIYGDLGPVPPPRCLALLLPAQAD